MTAARLEELVDVYLAERRGRGEVTASTARTYRRDLATFVEFAGAGISPRAITRPLVAEWVHKLEANLPAATVMHRLSALRGFAGWCVQGGLMTSNPCGDRRPRTAVLEQPKGRLGTLALRYVTERRQRGEITGLTPMCYRRALWMFAEFVGPDRDPRKVTVRNVERWVQSMAATAPATRRQRVSVLRTFFDWCVDHGHMRANPCHGLGRIRQPRRVPRGLSANQVRNVFAHCEDTRTALAVSLMVQEGLRRAEVASLQLGDIDMRDHTVRVVGKGDKERVLPVTDATVKAMGDYLLDWPAAAGPLLRSFRGHRGLRPITVGSMVSRAMHAAGVAESGHSLRHTAAGDVLRRGAHLRDVQAMLGHTSLSTTERYLPLLVGDLRSAMEGRDYRG